MVMVLLLQTRSRRVGVGTILAMGVLQYADAHVVKNKGNTQHTEDDIRDIRRRAYDGEKQADIAKRYNISEGHCSLIINRKKWGHIE